MSLLYHYNVLDLLITSAKSDVANPRLELPVGEVSYLERCAKRTRAVLDFSRSDEFYEHILLGSLSSIPRWRCDAALDAVDREPGAARSDEALMDLLDSTRGIVSAENCL